VNLSHYRSSADLEHGRHFTALPTAWVKGAPAGTAELTIGSPVAWLLSEHGAAGYLEFTGQGLGELRLALVQKEKQMATLGARLLEPLAPVPETATAVRLRHGGDHAALATLALAASQGLTQALRWHGWWRGAPDVEAVGAVLNRDFIEARLSPDEQRALVLTWQSGLISKWSVLHNFKQGELLPPGRTIEQELHLIEADSRDGAPSPFGEGDD